MTRDDIIRMAQECQLIGMRPHLDGIYEEALQEFGAMVASAEREACAKVSEKIEETCWESWDAQCDPLDQGSAIGAAHCAAAIRARGEG